MTEINIYTDGASKGNPGPAGYGWIMIINDIKYYQSFGIKHATNNQAELRAVLSVIKSIRLNGLLIDSKLNLKPDSTPFEINFYSDSQYVCNAFNKNWIQKWIVEDFKKIKNPEIWKELVRYLDGFNYKFIWVKGHNGNKYNEEADSLAQMACGHEGIVMQGFNKIQVENDLIS